MKDITSLKIELIQCENELQSITLYDENNYIDPFRAAFLKDKILYLTNEISFQE